MCKICGSREFIDYTVERDYYGEMRLGEAHVNVGALGEFISELNVIFDGDNEEIALESCVSLNNDADICENTRISIQYCPFCGREFGI